VLAVPARAQEPAPGPKEARAVLIEGRAPVLDGRLDDDVWSTAPAISDFTQKEPTEGAAATERTEVRFAYDHAALWVGARMHASDPTKIQAPVSCASHFHPTWCAERRMTQVSAAARSVRVIGIATGARGGGTRLR
jgi:hypothetical protein